jgi:hypothetical protein
MIYILCFRKILENNKNLAILIKMIKKNIFKTIKKYFLGTEIKLVIKNELEFVIINSRSVFEATRTFSIYLT